MATLLEFTTQDSTYAFTPSIIFDVYQQFTAVANATLSEVYINAVSLLGSNFQTELSIYSDNSGVPGAQISGTYFVNVGASGWVGGVLSSSIAIFSGTKYWIRVDNRGGLNDGANLGVDSNGGYGHTSLKWNGTSYDVLSLDFNFRIIGTLATPPTKATNPSPANSATGEDFSGLALDWDDGGGADTFDVYMGPIGALVKVADAIVPSTYTVDLSDVPTDQVIYWRVDATNVNGTTTGDTWNFDARPVKASTPVPADSASSVTLDETPLGWVDGGNADTYNVYFGESGSEVLVASLQAGIEWTIDFGTLAYGTTYGWRIDSVNDFGTTTGDTWTFDTITFNYPLPGAAGGGGGGGGGGGSGEEDSPTGENNMMTLRRLVAAANSKIWFEDV